jgi:hypothetical protein
MRCWRRRPWWLRRRWFLVDVATGDRERIRRWVDPEDFVTKRRRIGQP